MSQLMKKRFPSLTSIDIETDGNTSFLRAARNGQLDKVLEHLKSNIDINTSNANGLNALHLASKDGHVEIVEELLKRGAVIDAATKKGNTALHIASLAGQEEVVKLLVSHGASVNVQSQNGFTPLYMAAQENHDNVVKYLLANGANQSLSTEDGFTPLAVAMQQGHDKVVTVLLENDTRGKVRLPALHIAAKKDDVKAAKLLLENEHNPDVTSKSGFTPLHIASHYGNQSIANLLMQKGADVNYAAKHNITPLHVAAKWGKTNMVMVLLENGANIESKTRDGLTPLHCAARSGHEQVVDLLLEKGAPISSKTKNGLAPLHMAAQGDHVDAAKILLYHRAPVDEVTVDYLTALHVAAHCGHVRVAKLLLDRQADANARALNGFTPLHIACKKNRIKVVELLLKHGASIGATTESGLTPLHVASFMGCMNIVIYLLQHDADPDVPTVRGETPLHLAARANQTDIIRILLRNGAQVDARAREQQTPLHIASRLGNVDIVMLLLQHGAKVDNTTKDMYTALHIAAKEGQDEVAAALIDNGASLNATTKKGFTPLHLAAKYGHLKVAKLLLQKEAPVDAQGKNGVTPLHVASHYDHQNVALLLLEKGASPYATAKNGHTPLHIAAKKNQMDIANTLLEYGAKPNAESKAGFTPLHLSAQEGHCDMTELLIEHKADPNHRAKNGLTPLHLCAQEDKVPVAEILVKNGAEVDAATKNGYTPLHIASHYGQINMVRFLLAHGANVKATTALGYTPLHQAAQQGHTNIVNTLLENSAQPNAVTNNGQTPLTIAEKLGYITVIDTLKVVTAPSSPLTTSTVSSTEEKYRVVAPEAMHETFMSDSEEEGGEDTVLGDQTYRYLTADEMKSLGDDSLPIDVTRDERIDSNKMMVNTENMLPPRHIEDNISPEHVQQNYVEYIKKYTPDNVDIDKHPISIGFLVSFLVDARGGAMRGCRHSGVRVIVPPRCAPSPTRITCRYVRPQRTPHPPPLMEGEALASRVLELGPVGAKFLGPVIIEVPHFAALRGKEREIVILRSDNGESWKEHTVEATEDVLNEVLHDSFEAEDLNQLEDVSSGRITRIVTQDFPQYFAVVSRIRQEVHAIGPEGGMVSSTVVPQVQAVFPQGALTKKIKVGLQAQPIDPELTAKLLGHGVAVSPVVTVEPRRRKFHKAITLSMPAPRAHSQGMINTYSGSAPTLRLLCSITGGTTRAQWEDVTGSTPLTFVNDCVSFTTTVSARFWLMDCRNINDATKMATELYREAIHVPFMAKFVVFAKRVDPLEARLRVFCMTDDKEDKTLEHQEHFTEVAKSRDVEVLEGKPQYIEFAGNLVPITKSGEQLQFSFRAFRENRLPFSVRVKDQHAEAVSRCLFMREPKQPKGEPPQQPICVLNIVLPDDIVVDTISLTDTDSLKKQMFTNENFDYYRPDPRLADMSNLLGEDWVPLAAQLGLTTSEVNVIKSEYPDSVAKQAQSMLRMWLSQSGNKAQANTLESALRRIGREDIIPQCLNVDYPIKEISKQRLIKKNISLEKEHLFEKDIMKDSESVESLMRAEKRDEEQEKKKEFDKYSAEEKVVEETSDEEDFNKSVTERRHQIEERLSVDRTVPASQQRVEIVQEITSIKRQSLVENKIAEVKQKVGGDVVDVQKTTFITNELTTSSPSEEQVLKNLMDVSPDRRDSALLEGVTQGLETKKIITKISSTEDPKSPKVSKTPPPSPADFIIKEQTASIQEWDVSKKPTPQELSPLTKDAEQQGLSTTTERLVASNEETLLDKPLGQPLTGLSVIDDNNLLFDLKTVFEQTNAFIQSESQPEPYDALAEKYTKKEPINDKKVDDNKNNTNEKKKTKKGFFGSIKTFVERSFESDSESEKSPKKSKKPKKDKKKSKDEKVEIVSEPSLPPKKPKLPTPPLAPSDIDSIPFVEASVSDLPPPYKPPKVPAPEPEPIPVTDLDADLYTKPAAKLKIDFKETERESEKPKEKQKEFEKIKEKQKEPQKEKTPPKKKLVAKTIVVEEITKKIEPLVVETEEFSIVVDPTKKESPKKSKEIITINMDESVEKIEKQIMEKQPILSEEKIVKPIVAMDIPIRPPRTKDHIYEDIEAVPSMPITDIKNLTTNLIQNEINFGGWIDDTHKKDDETIEKIEKEEEIHKEIVEKQDKEVSKEKDAKVKPDDESKKKEEKKGGFFGLFKKKDSKKEDEEPSAEQKKLILSETVIKDMADTNKFLSDEVQNYHDMRPVVAAEKDNTVAVDTTISKPETEETSTHSEGILSLFKKTKKDEKTPGKKVDKKDSEKKLEKKDSDKKTKKDEKKTEPLSEKKVAVILSEEVLKNMFDSKRFLEGEVQNYHDVKPETVLPLQKQEIFEETKQPLLKNVIDEKKESLPKTTTEEKKTLSPDKKVEEKKRIDSREASPKPSFFNIFKKSRKDETEVVNTKATFSDEAIKDMKDTEQFLVAEIQNYHDAEPTKEEIEPKQVIETDKYANTVEAPQPGGVLGLFKKGKKEEPSKPQISETVSKDFADVKPVLEEIKSTPTTATKPQMSEPVLKDVADTTQFLNGEIESYHDVKPVKVTSNEEVMIMKDTTESVEQPSSGFFGLFKKTKKDDEKLVPEDTKEVTKEEQKTEVQPPVMEGEKATKIMTEEVTRESSPKLSGGFFGLFKKSKKDEEEAIPGKPVLSDSVLKDMNDTQQFLSLEVDKYEDVKPEKFEPIADVKIVDESLPTSPKSRGILGIFKKTKKEQEEQIEKFESKPMTSEAVTESTIIEPTSFPVTDAKPEKFEPVEDESFANVTDENVESSPKLSKGIFGIFKKSKKEDDERIESKPTISKTALKTINDSTSFLATEVQNYEDVKPEKFEPIQEERIVKVTEDGVESSPKSRGILGIFKKSKKEQEEHSQPKPALSEMIIKEMEDTNSFLKCEVQNYHDAIPDTKPEPIKPDVKPETVQSSEEEKVTRIAEEVSESSPKPSRGLFSIFKKSKKDSEDQMEAKFPLSSEIEESKPFLGGDEQNYHYVKPEKDITSDGETSVKALDEKVIKVRDDRVTKTLGEESQSSPKPSRGIFGIFKKSTKEEEEPVEIKVIVSEEVKKQIKDTDKFLTEEVKHYHDVKVSMEERVIKVSEEVKEASPKHAGILSLFKKSKKDEEERSTLSETVLKNMEETEQFLTVEVEHYHDVKPIISQERAPAKEEGPKEEALKMESTEDLQPKVEQPKGFLAKFKKTKKKPSLSETEGSGEVEKDVMDETKRFISTEMEKYEDGKLEEKKEDKVVTFDGTKSQMVLEGHLPELKIAQVVEVVKKDFTETVKETQGKVKEIDDVKKETTDEISSEKQEDQEPKIIKKDKQAKDKKGFLGLFGKKSKSQESSFDESRGREEESEGSPKKQKRRKSSSPFKFFDKMKKSDEDVKEEENEALVTTKVEEPLKETEESKEDLLVTEIKHPSLNLSEEVLGSLDKKMEELKSKYSPQTNKVINDCRDFLFIEVDNYEDSKPVVVTDIDAGVALKTVDDIIKKAEEIVDDSRVEIDDESQKFSDKVTTVTHESAGGIETAARTTEKTCKLVADFDEAPKKTAKKAGGFFSKLGGFITGAVEDSNSDLKEVKAAAEKTIDKKKKSVVVGIESTTKSVETKMEAVKDDVAKLEEQSTEILKKAKEDTVDATTKKYSELKEEIEKILQKTEAKYETSSGINDIKETVDIKIDEALESTKHIKEGADKTDNTGIEFEKVIKTGEDFKESYKQLQTISDKLSETTEKVQDELNQQIKQTSKTLEEAKDKDDKPSITLVNVCKSKVENLKEEVQTTKEKGTDSVVKIIDDLTRVKESATEAMTEKVKEVKSAAKSSVEKIVDKGQAKLDDIGKIKDDLVEAKKIVKESVEEKTGAVSKATDQIVHDFGKGKDTVQKALIQESYDISKAAGLKIDALSEVKDDTPGKLIAKVEDTEKIVDATLTSFTNETEKMPEKLTETEEDIEKIEQKAEDISKTKEKVVDDIAPTVETVHLLVGQKTEDISQIMSQKVDDLSNTKDSITHGVAVKIDDVKESISSLKERAEKTGETSAEKLSKANESVKMSVMQKVGEVSKTKDRAIDYISKTDRTIKDTVVQGTDDISKVAIQKTDDFTKTKEGLNEGISAKIEDFNKGIDTTATTLKERSEQITENLKEAKEAVKAAVMPATDDIFKATSKKTDDLGINKESVLGEFAKSKEDSQICIKDEAFDYQTTITQKMDDVSKATLQKIEDITKIDEKLKTSTDQRFDVCSKEDQKKTHDSVNIEEDNGVTVTKKKNEEAAQKVDELAKTSIQFELDEKKGELSKIAFQKIDDFTAAKETVTQMTDGTAKITPEMNGKKSSETRIDGSFKIASEKADDLVKAKESTKELTDQTVDDFLKTSIEKADDLTSTQKIDDLIKTQETTKETTVIHASKLIDSEVKGTTQAASTQDVKQLRADVVGTVTTKESLKDKIFQKAEKDSKITSQDTNRLAQEKQHIADEFEKSKVAASQKILGMKSDTSDGTATKEAIKRGYELKQVDDTSDLCKKASDMTSSKKEDISLKMMELDEELVKLTSSLEQLSETKSVTTKTPEKVKSYVTSPTMARRAESQRFPRGDRPAVREVISVQPDEDSDEECYTVTEPEEPKATKRRPLFHIESEEDDSLSEKLKERRDSATSNVLETLTETKLDTLLTNLENQLVEDLEKSVVEGRERVAEDKEKGDKKVMQVEKELETIKIESQADVEQIEQKLRDLDKALDSLEQASDPNSKLEKKLHRVERKFERMASEVMEKEITGASPTEVEARREHEFQKLVSQLSTEEVSDFQKEYSHLWDETTFSKSDEWDSKTPDSQVDVQELPQGEESSITAVPGTSSTVPEGTLKAESEEAASRTQQTDRTSQQRPIADQHQLSEEMKELLKELEKESKQ